MSSSTDSSTNISEDLVPLEKIVAMPESDPESEPVIIDTNKTENNADPADPFNQNKVDLAELISRIKQNMSTIKDNPVDMEFELPVSSITESIDLSQLANFKSSVNECDTLARDDNGRLIRLNDEQLASLRRNGTIEVPSAEYPNQNHTWKISRLVQKGTTNIKNSFYGEMAVTLRLFRYVVPHRIYGGNYITMASSVKNFVKGLLDIPVILFGWRNQKKKYNFSQIEERMSSYYIREFMRRIVIRPNMTDADSEDHDTSNANQDKYIESFELTNETKQFSQQKLRRMADDLKQPVLDLEKEWSDSANIEERRRLIWQKLYPDTDISDSDSDVSFREKNPKKMAAVLKKEHKAYKKKLFETIRSTLAEEEAEAFISLVENFELYRSRLTDYKDQRMKAVQAYRDELKTHSIKSRIPEWVESKMAKFQTLYDLEHPIEDIYDKVSARLHSNEKYIFDISRQILDSEEYANKKKRLQKKKIPIAGHTYSFRIWNPKSWIITQNGTHFDVKDSHSFAIKSLFPGWKIANIFVRFASYFWNGNFYLWYIMTREAFSLRSLVGIDNYYAGIKVDHGSGSLTPVHSRSTWFGRISKLWSNIKASRSSFEDQPDKGIIGKGITRIFNVLWNYGFKGILGTLLCLLLHPILAILCIVTCFTGLITSPIWAMLCSVFMYLFDILVYDSVSDFVSADTMSGEEFRKSIFPLMASVLYRMLLAGIGQFILSIVSMFAVSIGGLFVLLWSFVSNGIRSVYDAFVYYAILKHHAKVPAADGFLQKRIGGPGLSGSYYYEINRKLGLLAIQHALEELEMKIYEDRMKEIIKKPLQDLNEFYSKYEKLGLIVDRERKMDNTFDNTRRLLLNRLSSQIRDHRESTGLRMPYNSNLRMVKMNSAELQATLEGGSILCNKFMQKLMVQMTEDEQSKFWSSKRIKQFDYLALSSHCLEKVFGQQITVSIEAEDLDTSKLKRAELVIANEPIDRIVGDLFNGKPSDLLGSTYKRSVIHPPKSTANMWKKNIDIQYIFHQIDSFGVPHYDMVVSNKAYIKEIRKPEHKYVIDQIA